MPIYLFWDVFCMRNTTLKEFYYGNLTPADRQMIKGSEINHAVAELAKVEKSLLDAVEEDAIPLLKRYEKAQSALNSITAEASYIDGFKTGARFMLEVLDDAHENLEPISE